MLDQLEMILSFGANISFHQQVANLGQLSHLNGGCVLPGLMHDKIPSHPFSLEWFS